MADTFQAPGERAEVEPVDESAEPIIIRKLDKLETTHHTTPGS